ncbi:MAG: phosphoribosylformylglycinamidine synthase subunit PurQ [Thaumarchaeota archaeon]|nr:phosphoribosylformylglycinamidine synthase subunit PurQ [Nitrososphaerota archaeon]
MNVGITVFPGSNCDRDIKRVVDQTLKTCSRFYWHKKNLPSNVDVVIIPGGFSYGDYLRPGIIASHSPIIKSIKKLAKKKTPILGICNGFQILLESNLLPGTLLKNTTLSFVCKWTNIIVHNVNTPFTNQLKLYQKIPISIANGEGRYYVDSETLTSMKKNDQIVFKYENDSNNSIYNIAGVCNEDMNVVGMMPHPERAAEYEINPIDNKPSLSIFASILNQFNIEN